MEHHHHQSSHIGITVLLNLIITIAQAIGGFVSGSVALLSDATHNFSDVLTLIISYIANRFSKREANNKHTFGYKRSEIMAAFFNSTTLIMLSFFIIYEAVEHFLSQAKIDSKWVIYLAILSIAVNGFSALLLKKDAEHNLNMKSAYLHLFGDMMTSIMVLIGGLAMKYFQWFWVDSVFSILIAFYLLFLSWEIFMKSIRILMQHTPENIDIEAIISQINGIEGVKNLHHIHVWQLTDHETMFESHLDMEHNLRITDFEAILQKIQAILADFDIHHSTIQPELTTADDKKLFQTHQP
jgi:cobalt-zinc-cadmium efflux system protein